MHDAAQLVRKEELLRLLLAGFMLKEAARYLKLSYKTVRKYAGAEDFMIELREHSSEVFSRVDTELRNSKDTITERIVEASDDALEVVISLSKQGSDQLRLKASQDILDRNIVTSKTRKVEGSQTNLNIDIAALVLAAKAIREEDEYNTEHNGNGREGERGGVERLPPAESD